jgi:diacylglycerol O-acyltransferase / wax synthase
MTTVPVNDAMYLIADVRGHPVHGTALQLFEPPADASHGYLSGIYDDLLTRAAGVKHRFCLRPRRSLTSPSGWAWERLPAQSVRLDEHIHLQGLPTPGTPRRLFQNVSRLHAVRLDWHRPLWDFDLIEGMDDGRFATVTRFHHAISDGASMVKHISGGLSSDPGDRDGAPAWLERSATDTQNLPSDTTRDGGTSLGALARAGSGALGASLLGPKLLRSLAELRGEASRLPFEAPSSMFNVKIGPARRFAGDIWPVQRLKALSAAAAVATNDVVLAMSGAALRRYMVEQKTVPDRSLVTMVPLSLRREDEYGGRAAGNLFGAVMVSLGTDHDDPLRRLEGISAGMNRAKALYASLERNEAMALAMVLMSGGLLSLLGVGGGLPRQPHNLVISNVSFGATPLYWNGARMTDVYPVSVIGDGMALNITVTRYVDSYTFGLVGCPRAVPHVHSILGYLEDALCELEHAIGI